MIPKKIHYCWFGKNKKSKIIEKCIKSWKEKCPDFEIIEWNESNFDINIYNFTKQAYEQKMWAYVADYVRFYILEKEGGIYLDTDMLLFEDLTPLLDNNCFLGFQDFYGKNDTIRINGSIIGMKKNNKIGNKFLDYYNNLKGKLIIGRNFVIPEVIKKVLDGYNIKNIDKIQKLEDNILIYPIEYFYIEDIKYKTNKSYAIHLGEGSWLTSKEKVKKTILSFIIKILKILKIENFIKIIYRKIKGLINK